MSFKIFAKFRRTIPLLAVSLTACAGAARSCSSDITSDFGADWVVVQYTAAGRAFNCWMLHDVSMANEPRNEPRSDGIYWKSAEGHLVHISGWYNRVQVSHGDFRAAARMVGVDDKLCRDGIYTEPTVTQ